jgi:glycosyltransferase involved in cell wall biosynthesis
MHTIDVKTFIPFNKISSNMDGVTVFNQLTFKKYDLIHAFNRIPLGLTPFIIGFESHLPRAFGLERSAYFRWLSGILASDRCRKIICISNHARQIFADMHAEDPLFPSLAAKLITRYPNLPVPAEDDAMAGKPQDPLTLTFVGGHFGRKGGCVAVRMAELALSRSIPIAVNIVSDLQVGPGVWTDPMEANFFEPYFKLLNLPNVRHYSALPNARVLELLRQSHFSILTTFSDTFGYSAIESMMNFTPVIATRQGALPEFIHNGENGILLDLPTNSLGEWTSTKILSRRDSRYKAVYAQEIDRLAEDALSALVAIMNEPGGLKRLRLGARKTAAAMFSAADARLFWDALYEEAAALSQARRPVYAA